MCAIGCDLAEFEASYDIVEASAVTNGSIDNQRRILFQEYCKHPVRISDEGFDAQTSNVLNPKCDDLAFVAICEICGGICEYNHSESQVQAFSLHWAFNAAALAQVIDALSINDFNSTTPFDSSRVPELSVREYADRLHQRFACSSACFILAMVYIRRLIGCHSCLLLTVTNVHRLLLTGVVVAAKFHDDFHRSNPFYAKTGGLRIHELNALESLFLHMLRWNLFVSL